MGLFISRHFIESPATRHGNFYRTAFVDLDSLAKDGLPIPQKPVYKRPPPLKKSCFFVLNRVKSCFSVLLELAQGVARTGRTGHEQAICRLFAPTLAGFSIQNHTISMDYGPNLHTIQPNFVWN